MATRCAHQLAPTWPFVTFEWAVARVKELSRELDKEEQIEQIKLKLKKARSDLKSEQEGPVPVPAEPGTEAPTGAWKLIQAAEKVRKLESQLEKAETAKKRRGETVAEFQEARSKALKLILEYSGLADLFEEPIKKLVQRLISIPRRKLDMHIMETMIHLAELLPVRGTVKELEVEELEAAEALAAYLLELSPEERRVTAVLLDLIIPQLTSQAKRPNLLEKAAVRLDLIPRLTSQANRPNLLKKAKEHDRKIFEKWMKTNPRSFSVLFWYCWYWYTKDEALSWYTEDKGAGLLMPERIKEIKERDFGEAPDEFDYLCGWVLFRREDYKGAAAAFRSAIKAWEARYHLDLGKSRRHLQDWEHAPADYHEPRRNDPDNAEYREYRERLASAFNQIGDRHRESGRFADAADNYEQAVRLASRTAVYHRNLALARERAKLPDEISALEFAVGEMRKARSSNRGREIPERTATVGNAPRCASVLRVVTDHELPDPRRSVRRGVRQGPRAFRARKAQRGDGGRSGGALQSTAGTDLEPVWRQRAHGGRRLNETEITRNAYRVMADEVPIVTGTVEGSKKLCPRPATNCGSLDLSGLSARDPLGGGEAVWLDGKDGQQRKRRSCRCSTPSSMC